MEMRRMLGQKLVFGFHGKTLPEEFKNLLREYKIGNVILFLRNVESAEQLRALCAEIQSLVQEETGYPAFIIIDQEGGMVTRLPWDAVNVPGSMALTATGKPENAVLAAEITARQLRGGSPVSTRKSPSGVAVMPHSHPADAPSASAPRMMTRRSVMLISPPSFTKRAHMSV